MAFTFKKFPYKNPLAWLYIGGAVLVIVAVGIWCFKISLDPERVFWGTVERSLATRGVTVQAQNENNGTTVDQTIRLSLGADSRSHSLTTLKQQGTTIKTETIGTPTADYNRYTEITTDQKRADGGDIDASEVLGVWGKSQEGAGSAFSQTILGSSLPLGGIGVPIGDLSPEDRANLVRQIREDVAYQVDFSKTKKERVDGRLRYTYDVMIQPVAYIAMIKQFSANVGMHGLDQIDPNDYSGQQPFRLLITVDARAHQVVKLSSPENGVEQTYSGHDVPVRPELPEGAIAMTELQKRLSDLQ